MQGKDIVETSNNEFLVLVIVPPAYGYDMLVRLSANGEAISQYHFGSPDTIISLSGIHRFDDNHIVLTGLAQFSENLNDCYALQIHLDDELHINEQIYTQIQHHLEIFYTTLDDNNNLIWAGSYGSYGSLDIIIIKIDMFGNLLNSTTHIIEGNHFVNDVIQFFENPIKYGISVTGPMEGYINQGQEFFLQFDEDLQYLKTDKIPNIRGVGNTNMAIVDNGLIAFAGKSFSPCTIMSGFDNHQYYNTLEWIFANYTEDANKSVFVLADESISTLGYITFGDGIVRDFPAPYRAISSYEPHIIYTAGIKNIIPTQWPYQNEASWIRVNKLDNELNIIWEKYIGGDAYYQVNSVTATSDGGVVLSGFKTYPGQAPLMNLLAIKLKPDGTVSLDEYPAVESAFVISVFPNPANTETQIQFAENAVLENAMIELYCPSGRLLYIARPTNHFHPIDVAHLSQGMYLLRLWDGERWRVQKLMKQ
ncbi:MAG: T9SS type A sorting domain-containing protein [Bacteroidales bacterium]|nr:T9SS type A sorting domain-containing protein [Bacteroidales bacterium]MDD3702457.1 T9SS type A sorting domain-containing protein [Bacteroidales bacterium]